MSYTKQTWATGDTVTASKLNHMEDGIAGAGGGIVLDLVGTTTPLTMTFEEIADAIGSGTNVYIKNDNHEDWSSDYTSSCTLGRVVKAYKYDTTYRIVAEWGSSAGTINTNSNLFAPAVLIFSASDYNAYPVFYKTVYPTISASIVTVDSNIY